MNNEEKQPDNVLETLAVRLVVGTARFYNRIRSPAEFRGLVEAASDLFAFAR